ncbi:MAG: tetratricopeptide repeat protein [Acetobacterales bacterium]
MAEAAMGFRRGRRRGIGRAVVVLALLTVAGCAWRPALFADPGELGYEALEAGDYPRAEELLKERLAEAPVDPYARLNLASVYQNTGREAEARTLLLEIVRDDPEARAARSNREGAEGERLATIARRNLALLDARVQTDDRLNGLAVAHMGHGDWLFAGIYADAALALNRGDPYAALNRGAVAAREGDRAAADAHLSRAIELGRTALIARSSEQGGEGRTVAQLAEENRERLSEAGMAERQDWPESGARFTALRRLRDRGLISPEEYFRRRDANLAAVVPGGGVAATTTPAEVEALLIKLLSRYQLGDLSAEEYGALRSIVLDRVLPAAPVPALPAGRAGEQGLDRLQEAGVITDDERDRLAARLPAMAGGETATVQRGTPPPSAASLEPGPFSGTRLGVQLASYRKPENARKGWDELKAASQGALERLTPAIVRIDLGRGIGVYYRLYAGEVESVGAAQRICTQMKARGRDCVVGRY